MLQKQSRRTRLTRFKALKRYIERRVGLRGDVGGIECRRVSIVFAELAVPAIRFFCKNVLRFPLYDINQLRAADAQQPGFLPGSDEVDP